MKTFAVMLFGKIGDVVNTSVVCRELKKNFPDSRIIYITLPFGAEAASAIPAVDKVYVFNQTYDDKSIDKFFKQIQSAIEVRFNEKVDVAIALTDTFRCAIHGRLIGAKKILGRDTDKRGFLITDKLKLTSDDYRLHMSEFHANLLSLLDIKCKDYDLDFKYDEGAKLFAEEFINKNGLSCEKVVGVNLTTACPTKDWTVDDAISFVNMVTEKTDYKIVFVGDKKASLLVDNMRQKECTNFIDMTGKTTIMQVAALIDNFDKFITPDTGLAHIAFALKTPTVVVAVNDSINKINENLYVWGPKDLTLNKVVYNPNGVGAKAVFDEFLLLIPKKSLI